MEEKKKKMRSLCRTHMRQLRKVTARLAYKQKMDGTQLVLCEGNKEIVKEAEQLIYKAINLLSQVK